MCQKVVLFLCLASYVGSFLTAQGNAKSSANKPGEGEGAAQFALDGGDNKCGAGNSSGSLCRVSWTMPVWSEIVNLSYPVGFHSDYENTRGGHYMIELVPKGETAYQWSQMVTDTFSSQAIGPAKISGHDAYVAWASCGTVKPDGSGPRGEDTHSESALIVTIHGMNDYYTVQWAERGPVSSQPLVFDSAKWADRLPKLNPIKLRQR